MSVDFRLRGRLLLHVMATLLVITPYAEAGGLRRAPRQGSVVVRRVQPTQIVAPRTGTLGTFAATPYIWVRSNGNAGGGYSPLGTFGDTSMVINGPFSAFRAISAPVATYTRGYDGRTVLTQGTSFSTPNLPSITPVDYPTQANVYDGFKVSGDPPWWQDGSSWIDHN